jgi:hypothetical protein
MAGFSFWDYVRRAFHAKVPVKGLGPISLNKWGLAGAAILGFGFHPLWLLAIGVEVMYLYSLATNRRFRNLIDAEAIESAKVSWDERVAALKRKLSRDSRERFDRLTARCLGIQDIGGDAEPAVATIEETKRSGMDQLLYMYLRLLVSRDTIDVHFPPGERDNLKREIAGIEAAIASPGTPETVRKSREGTLEIQRRRLDNVERAGEQRAVIESEMERIEKQVELIREDTAMGREPAALTTRIDQVVNTLGETSEWMRRNADLIGDIGEDKPREVPVFLRPRAKEGE